MTRNCKYYWEVKSQVKNRQTFISTFDEQESAAVIFDLIQLQRKGISSRANFKYSLSELMAILSSHPVYDDDQ